MWLLIPSCDKTLSACVNIVTHCHTQVDCNKEPMIVFGEQLSSVISQNPLLAGRLNMLKKMNENRLHTSKLIH